MNGVRVAISLFIVVLIGLSTAGWIWTGAHQSAAQSTASRTVLALGIMAGLVGLRFLWGRREA